MATFGLNTSGTSGWLSNDTSWSTNVGGFFWMHAPKIIDAVMEADAFARKLWRVTALAGIRRPPLRKQREVIAIAPVVLRMERRARGRESVRPVIRQRRRLRAA